MSVAPPAPTGAAAEVWDLVVRAQSGDQRAFELIYLRYQDIVYRFVYFRVGNRSIAEDITAETFLRALSRIGSVTWQGRDLGAWLVTIARNKVADHYKSGRYRLEVATADVLQLSDAAAKYSEHDDPAVAVMAAITSAELRRAMAELSESQRECLTLRVFKGYSVAETAQRMGKEEGAVKALQYRAVRALARLLPPDFIARPALARS